MVHGCHGWSMDIMDGPWMPEVKTVLLPTVSTTTNPVWLLLGSELAETEGICRLWHPRLCHNDLAMVVWFGVCRHSTLQNTSFSH